MRIRTAAQADLKALAAVEAACFPPAEAADEASIARRLAVYPDHFWLLEDEGTLVSFVDGMVTDEPFLRETRSSRWSWCGSWIPSPSAWMGARRCCVRPFPMTM